VSDKFWTDEVAEFTCPLPKAPAGDPLYGAALRGGGVRTSYNRRRFVIPISNSTDVVFKGDSPTWWDVCNVVFMWAGLHIGRGSMTVG
jgi:hypothetical protein